MRKPDKYFVFNTAILALLCVCYFGCLLSYGNIPAQSGVSVLLSDHYPGRTEIRQYLETRQENGEAGNFCFLQEAEQVTVQEELSGRQSRVFLVKLMGNAALFDWRIGGFSQEDREGCVIGRKTALELFGTDRAEGREIRIQEKSYSVRCVINWKQNLIVVHDDKKEAVYSKVLLNVQEGQSTDGAVQTLQRFGLNGEQADGGILASAAGMAVFIVPLMVFLDLLFWTGRQRRLAGNRWERWLWAAACIALFILMGWAVLGNLQISMDWLPGKWSDFSFWGRRIREESEKLLRFFSISHTGMEFEMMYYAGNTVIRAIVCVLLYLWWIIFRMLYKNIKS